MRGGYFGLEGRDESGDDERDFRDLLGFKVQGAIEGRGMEFNMWEDMRECILEFKILEVEEEEIEGLDGCEVGMIFEGVLKV